MEMSLWLSPLAPWDTGREGEHLSGDFLVNVPKCNTEGQSPAPLLPRLRDVRAAPWCPSPWGWCSQLTGVLRGFSEIRHIRYSAHHKCSTNATEMIMSYQSKSCMHGLWRGQAPQGGTPQKGAWGWGSSQTSPTCAERHDGFKCFFGFRVAGSRFVSPAMVNWVCTKTPMQPASSYPPAPQSPCLFPITEKKQFGEEIPSQCDTPHLGSCSHFCRLLSRSPPVHTDVDAAARFCLMFSIYTHLIPCGCIVVPVTSVGGSILSLRIA